MKNTQEEFDSIVAVGNREIKGYMGGRAGFPFLDMLHKRIYWFCLIHPYLIGRFKWSNKPFWPEAIYFRLMRGFYHK